jgi:serine protein kinase
MTMTKKNVDFLDLIKRQRDTKKDDKFSGTFLEYLNIVKENSKVTQLAHRRLHDAIKESGVHYLDESNERCRNLFEGEKLPVYNYFESEFFGMEKVLAKLMRFLKSAAMKGEESRQVLLLMGPVGAGKSALMESVKKALEGADPVYYLDGCPMREEPLHLVPRSLREDFGKILGVTIEGDLCPVCRYRLKNEFNNEYEKFPVKQTTFSIRGRRGVGVVPPIDANTQDISILVGTEDISKMDMFSEDDPRVLSLTGAFNVGNRGVVEFVEIFKNEIEFLHTIITATQEKAIPSPGKNAMIYFDGVILAHCNEAEWNKFKTDHANEAILDRIVKIDVPYCLELDEEVKIYKKILDKSDFGGDHIAPHTLEIASMFSILSRLKRTEKCDPLTKLKIYNGESIVEKGRVKKIDIKDLREEVRHEGMTGISTRFIMKAIDNALADSEKNMITPISVKDALIKQVKDQVVDEAERSEYLEHLQKTIHDEYLQILEKEITKAFVSAYDEQAESLFNNYLDNAEAYVNKVTLKDQVTKEVRDPDEDFMKSIEEQIGITSTAAAGFRSDVVSYMFTQMRHGDKVKWNSHEPLREAIEGYLMSSVRNLARVVTKSKTRDDKQKKKYNEMVETLIENYGYNEDSAEEVLRYASNHLWRDS